MIGLARSERARAWQIAAVLAAVRRAFPSDKVRVSRSTLNGAVLTIVISRAIEDPRELATWRPRGLRIAFPVLAACADEAAVARLVESAVSRISRGAVAEIPEIQETPPTRAPRLGRRVDAEKLRQQLRGAVWFRSRGRGRRGRDGRRRHRVGGDVARVGKHYEARGRASH